ncbi:uncharacterized protein EI90DRAFT_2183963 [Cantharellus anzutake]|uniref:uncharacterized protein n=1 Tax=Cantharellus anzutake TaxID=1750568 RepID=UPI0019049665|nr:uncharacterized protein EI90DRAFT_2183963 [Cantharellus anzutake]KAF8325250.1 hypothetical protein EI90DRAFT_2183963 [Cantharellus anzutake]
MPVPVPASPTLHCILISNSHTLLDASLFPSHIPTNRAFAPCEPKETDSFPLPLYTLRTNPAGKQTFISGADRGPFAAVNWSSASASHSQSPCENANGNSLSFFKSAMTSDTGLLVGSHGLHGFSKKFRLITTLEINKKIRLIMYAPPSPSSAPASSSSTTSTSTSGGYSTWNPPPFPSIAYRTLLDTIVLTGLLMTVGTEDIVGFCSSTPSPSVLPESGARRTLGSSAAGSTRSPRAHSSSAPEPSCAVTTSGSGSGSRSMKAPWAHWVVPGNGDGMSGSTRNLIGRRSRSSRGDNSATSSQTSTETSKSSMSKMSKGCCLVTDRGCCREGKERKKEDGKRKHSAGILKSMLPMISAFALGPGGGPFGSSITTTPSSSVPDFEEEKHPILDLGLVRGGMRLITRDVVRLVLVEVKHG